MCGIKRLSSDNILFCTLTFERMKNKTNTCCTFISMTSYSDTIDWYNSSICLTLANQVIEQRTVIQGSTVLVNVLHIEHACFIDATLKKPNTLKAPSQRRCRYENNTLWDINWFLHVLDSIEYIKALCLSNQHFSSIIFVYGRNKINVYCCIFNNTEINLTSLFNYLNEL